MLCKKRNEPDGQPPPSSLLPQRLHRPEAESASSLDSEPTCFVPWPPFSDPGYSTSADRKFAVTVGKRSCTRSWRAIDVEGCSKRSRVEYSDATVSGVTFQKDLKPDAESGSASVSRHVGSCHDSGCLNSKRSKLGAIRCNETDVDEPGIQCNESDARNETDVDKPGTRCDADKHVAFICRGDMSLARQGIRETAFSSISCCGQSRDGSHSNSRNTSFLSHVRDPSKTSLPHLGKAEAGNQFVSSKNVAISPQISSKEPRADAMHTKGSPPSYVLSSGRLSLEEEARLGRRLPTIDDDFEEYFSSLML